jgi:hypothetical protein
VSNPDEELVEAGRQIRARRLLEVVTMPPRIARLPRNKAGYPIPWFVAELDDGTRDFRVASEERQIDAIRLKLCWVCGGPSGAYAAFVIGPMCAVNRISAEPPAHRDCAIYSARVCPFLAVPRMRRRENNLPDGMVEAAGGPIRRNPGVALVWVTRTFTVFRAPMGNQGRLHRFGDPTEVLWYAEGRTATRAEILASMESGLPALQEACQLDDDPADSLRMLDKDYQRALALLPQEVAGV